MQAKNHCRLTGIGIKMCNFIFVTTLSLACLLPFISINMFYREAQQQHAVSVLRSMKNNKPTTRSEEFFDKLYEDQAKKEIDEYNSAKKEHRHHEKTQQGVEEIQTMKHHLSNLRAQPTGTQHEHQQAQQQQHVGEPPEDQQRREASTATEIIDDQCLTDDLGFRPVLDTIKIATAPKSSFRHSKILCFVNTYDANHQTKAKAVMETWGPKCDKLVFASNKTDESIGSIRINASSAYDELWGKHRETLRYIYSTYKNEYDWFFKADDDTFVIVENLRAFLNSEEVQARNAEPLYIGSDHGGLVVNEKGIVEFDKTFLDLTILRRYFERTDNKFVYNVGGAGYALNHAFMEKLMYWIDREECAPNRSLTTFLDDNMLAVCAANFGSFPYNTRDYIGRERFHQYPPSRLYAAKPGDELYEGLNFVKRYSGGFEGGESCCSTESISFHYIDPIGMHHMHNILYRCQKESLRNKNPRIPPGSFSSSDTQHQQMERNDNSDHPPLPPHSLMIKELSNINIKYYIYDDKAMTCNNEPFPLPPHMQKIECDYDKAILEALSSHPLRTGNPEEAQLFIVPILLYKFEVAMGLCDVGYGLCDDKYSKSNHDACNLHDAFKALTNSKLFQQHNGNHHVIIGTEFHEYVYMDYHAEIHETMIDIFYNTPTATSNSLRNITVAELDDMTALRWDVLRGGLNGSDYEHEFRQHYIPITKHSLSLGLGVVGEDDNPIDNHLPIVAATMKKYQHSKYTIFYRTRTTTSRNNSTQYRHAPITRVDVSSLPGGAAAYSIGNDLEHEEWISHFTNSKFCLVIRGDLPPSHALERSIRVGCIPVIISDLVPKYTSPLKSTLDMHDYAIILNETEFLNNPQEELAKLNDIPLHVIQQKLHSLAFAQRILLLEHPDSLFVPAFLKEARNVNMRGGGDWLSS